MVFDMPVLKETIMYVSLFLSTGVREFLAVWIICILALNAHLFRPCVLSNLPVILTF